MGGIRAPRGVWKIACRFWLALVGLVIAASPVVANKVPAPARLRVERLTLIVPAAVGGGWDLTAKAMKVALEDEGLVGAVNIVRYPGAGGLVGLTQFVNRHRGSGDVLLVGGLVLMGSSIRDESAITLRDVTPVARLTGDWGMLVTSTISPIQSVRDIVETMRERADGIRWAGGALGGPDQGLVWRIAQKTGASIDEIPYYGRAGGRRVADALSEGRTDIGLSGYSEFAPFLTDGRLRVLAVASPERIPGIDAPTLRESGIDVTMMNWRGVFMAPGVSAEQQDQLSALIGAMATSASWHKLLRQNRWTDTYLGSEGFSQFIEREQARWQEIINPPERENAVKVPPPSMRVGAITAVIALLVFAIASVAAAVLAWRLHRRRQFATLLERRCQELAQQLDNGNFDASKLVKDGIDNDFGEWNLSHAEADIAWFMLRGLPLREIAALRGTSERTVRQQAQAIYRKAGLEGRSDLAGRVLERFI
jgi:putative tricarboxylic transport membrane protein